MNFDHINFVRFLSASRTLTKVLSDSRLARRRKKSRHTDLGKLENFAAFTDSKASRSAFQTSTPHRTTSIRNDIYDNEVEPTVENLKRLRALRAELVQFCWGTTTAKLFHLLRIRQAHP